MINQGWSQTLQRTNVREVPHQTPVTLTDISGTDVTIQSAERIVTLNGDVTEVVFALGFGHHVIAVDISSSYPDSVKNLPKVSNQRRLSAEGILSLNPTLVIGTEHAGPPEVVEQLRQSGIPLVLVPDPTTLESPMKKIQMVGQALGIPEKGTSLATRVKLSITQAQRVVDESNSHPRVLFLYLRGNQVQLAAGDGTHPHVLIEAAGARNAGEESGIRGYKPLTPEALVTANPDILLVPERGLESVGGMDGLLQIPGIAQTKAGRSGRVVSFDDLYLLGMGPRTGKLLVDLVRAFHPQEKSPTHSK